MSAKPRPLQFVFALALAKIAGRMHSGLWLAHQGVLLSKGADQDPAVGLYDDVGNLTLAECVSEPSARAAVADALARKGVG